MDTHAHGHTNAHTHTCTHTEEEDTKPQVQVTQDTTWGGIYTKLEVAHSRKPVSAANEFEQLLVPSCS